MIKTPINHGQKWVKSMVYHSHLLYPSLSPCLPLEVWIMFSFVVNAMWALKVISCLKLIL